MTVRTADERANSQASMIAQGLFKMGHPAFHAIPTAAAVPNSAKWPRRRRR
jgi:hypothetical protein